MENSDPRSVQWQLPAALLEAIEHQAATEGLPAERIAARVLEAGLIELGLMPNGRCSVRTGLCGSGPVPLPVQQSSGASAVA
jgi:hypothetical protein